MEIGILNVARVHSPPEDVFLSYGESHVNGSELLHRDCHGCRRNFKFRYWPTYRYLHTHTEHYVSANSKNRQSTAMIAHAQTLLPVIILM